MRGHRPIILEEFNGLWKRGQEDSCPPDHFIDCNNIDFSQSGVRTRDGIYPYLPYANVVRIYPFNQSILVLDTNGNLFHSDRATPFVPILTINGMTDFAFVKFANRAYISPIGDILSGEFLYVYEYGSALPARKAGGAPPALAPIATLSGTNGNVEEGIHIFAVAYETNTGFITSLSPGVQLTVPAPGDKRVELTAIPVSAETHVTARWIVATKLIDPADFTGQLDGYQFFFVDRIPDNVTTTLSVNFYDAELLEDASHLDDLFEEIPNVAGLNLYHGRLIAWAPDRGSGGEFLSTTYVSFPGEPEAISQVDGLFALPPDGRPITYCQEFRDILYVFKSTKTIGVNDNNDVPSSWPQTIIDQGIGAGSAHSVAVIMDSGGVNINYLLVGHYAGIHLFDGAYRDPAITFKIYDLWKDTVGNNRTLFPRVQIVVNSFNQEIYIVKPDFTMLKADFKNGLDAQAIRWTPWTFDVAATTICVLEEAVDIKLIIGSKELVA